MIKNKTGTPRRVDSDELNVAVESGDEKLRRIVGTEWFTRYVYTIDTQYGYESYRDQTVIDDVLYGLGVSLEGHKHTNADGFERFLKDVLVPHLKKVHPRAFEDDK